MPWQMLWPDFLKKRLCRYLLQHYLGHFFKEKISLEQLSIDIYNGTGCVKNLNLDCEALNEQLNAAAAATNNGGGGSSSAVPIEIVSGFVGYISVYIPWHDLFNDYCKLTIKNVQITIRTKQRKQTTSNNNSGNAYRRKSSSGSGRFATDLDDSGEAVASSYFDMDDMAAGGNDSNSMFSSMFVDSLMNTSMHIAQECLSNNKNVNINNNGDYDDNSVNSDEENFNSINNNKSENNKNSLLGLEAFASTIDSILSRIKINMEQIQIRIENLDTMSSTSKLNESNIMSSSAVFTSRPSNGIALELRIKSIKYFDIDSTIINNQNKTDTTTAPLQQQTNINVRNTTKSFNIEGLTIYFDEFIVKDDSEINCENFLSSKSEKASTNLNENENLDLSRSLNSTIDLTTSSIEQPTESPSPLLASNKPLDESPPFSYDLNPDYYLYTNPIILITFSGIQTIKLTINNMRPTDLIIEATASSSDSHATKQTGGINTAGTIDSNDKLQLQQQRPFLELNAQFGSIKCLMSPKQIHLLTAMCTKLSDYMEAANATRKAFKSQHQRCLNKFKQKKSSIRGCGDKRKFEALIQNDLIYNSNSATTTNNGGEDVDEEEIIYNTSHFKTIDNETSVMFYSMMSESSAAFNTTTNNQNLNSSINSHDSSGYENHISKESNKENIYDNNTNNNDNSNNNNETNSGDKQTQSVIKELKQTIEQLQTDVIMANKNNNNNQHNLFQTFKVTFRMFSLTILHHDPTAPVTGQSNQNTQQHQNYTGNEYSSTKRLLVDRMKHLSDSYFDWVSTIDASNLTSGGGGGSGSGSSASSIDKNTITKYHQACPFNDHFLFLLKPINLNLVQKINQRHLNTKQSASKMIQYSLNEVSLSIGYIQIDEYLVAASTSRKQTSTINNASSNNKRFKTAQIVETCQAATITEIMHFNDSFSASPSSLSLEQPCFKVQFVFYEPLDVLNKNSKRPLFTTTTNNNIQTNLLSNHFENISINLNQSLSCELDISLIDRLYYLINDTTSSKSKKSSSSSNHNPQKNVKSDQSVSKVTKNLEIKCSQIIKIALRFPIADLRRSQPAPTSTNSSKSQPKTTASTLNPDSIIPVTLIAFRQLREQILTLHLFDFNFQTLLSSSINISASSLDNLNLTLTSSQINAYYQYTKKDRPIHFGLIQQRLNEPRSLICSIKLPASAADSTNELFYDQFTGQILTNNNQDCLFNIMTNDTSNMDSLKNNYNINVGKANRFRMAHTIKEENENSREDLTEKEEDDNDEEEELEEDSMNGGSGGRKKMDANGNDDDDEDENEFSPFSRIHSLISSEKNRRIVNAGNKSEMQSFINQSKSRSETTITLVVPQIKFLIADQKFLNDIYNCILNDLIMWVPSPVPPVESVMTSLINDAYISGSSYLPGLNFLVDYNYENDFIATRVCEEEEEENNNNNNNEIGSRQQHQQQQQQFHMCRSAILKPSLSKSDSENSDYCESDDDQSKRKYQQKYDDFAIKNKSNKQQALLKSSKNNNNKNTLSFIFCIESAHLKAFILNSAPTTAQQQALKYGEFDIKANNFQMCIAISESLKSETQPQQQQQQQSNKNRKQKKSKQNNSTFKIEKQQICIFTDQINISHSTKTCPNNVTQLKYPTNFSSFETLFQISKTKDLITLNDPAIVKSLFSSDTQSGGSQQQQNQQNLISVPMVSIGIKSKFNTKKNTKQLLVALNFNNLTLHHLFCAQPDYWIFQLILLFDLIDIDIVGYEVPIVLTELHLNVANSCVVYKPAYLDTHSIIAFKSLHWSSNVTAESSLTLLVFNIEDIYLFLSKQQQQKQHNNDKNENTIDLKKDYICVANSDLFELRLFISDEEMNKKNNAKFEQNTTTRKSPLLDIKIRSNLIQLRTCVDSAFTLIELINYIVSDGDLHKPNLIMSEFMTNNNNTNINMIQPSTVVGTNISTLNTIPSSSQLVEMQQLNEQLNDALPINKVKETLNPSSSNLSKAINIASSSSSVSSSIPIQRKPSAALFTVGTPPSSSLKSSSSSFSQQIFYSPSKINNNNMSPVISSVENTQYMNNQQRTQPITVPLPSPSLSFVNFNKPTTASTSNSNTMTSAASFNGSSSAESLISDMVKEAMTSNPMTMSIYGSLPPTKDLVIGARKRNPSLTLLSPDLQTKRLISHSFMQNTNIDNTNKLNTLKENSNLSSLRNSDDEDEDDDDDDDDNLIQLNKNNKTDFFKDLKKIDSQNNDDEDESLIASIHFNHKKSLLNSKKPSDDESEEEEEDDEDSDENYSENTMNKSNDDQDDEDFHFDLPFSNISPMTQKCEKKPEIKSSNTSNNNISQNVNRQLMFDKNNRRLHFKPNNGSDEDDAEETASNNYVSKNINQDDDDDENEDEDLLRDFDIIDVIPGFGEPPRNNQDFEVKNLRQKTSNSVPIVLIKEDHFKKPLTKIDVLKAPDSYPCPLNVYCIQEISVNWCLYGGSDFSSSNQFETTTTTTTTNETNNDNYQPSAATNKINRTLSSPIIVASSVSPSQAMYLASRSRNSSTSSNSLSMSPQLNYQQSSPGGQQQQQLNTNSSTSPSTNPISVVKFNNKSASVNFSKEKYLPRKAGGRIIHKYDTNSLNWLARGGKSRNLDVCMEIALYKVKTKIDMYSDLNDMDENENKENKQQQQQQNESPYLYRVALAIGDIEIRDKLASSPFNMFLFRYESDHCPKHTNSNMLFIKFLCSKSMDAQRLIECDIKLSIQPLRFNIDQDALIFLVEFFTKLASKDLNEFSKTLVPPPPAQSASNNQINESDDRSEMPTDQPVFPPMPQIQPQTPQQIFIRNFIFSPDLLVRFDFSGKYDSRSDTKMDTLTKLLMVAIQLSNTEIKLKRICYRRGFLGAEKLLTALIKEWLSDIQRNQMKNLIKGWGIFNSLIQFFEGFTYLIWYPIEQYRKDGRVLCGIQKGSAAFSTCTVLATIELTNRMFQATKNIAEFFYDLVTPHRANSHHHHNLNMLCYGSNNSNNNNNNNNSNNGLVDTILTGVGNNRNIRLRRHPNDIREGLTNAYYVMYEGINDTAANLMQEINQGAEHKGIPGAIGGALRQLPSTALAPIVLTTEATCNILSGIRNQLKPDEKRDDDQKWKTIAFNS